MDDVLDRIAAVDGRCPGGADPRPGSVFRFTTRFVMGHTATLDQDRTVLGASSGETVTVRDT